MEQTTLQQRIEERAANKLRKDLYEAAQKEMSIENMLNVFDTGKPNAERLWIRKLDVQEEILNKIDEIDYLVKEEQYNELP